MKDTQAEETACGVAPDPKRLDSEAAPSETGTRLTADLVGMRRLHDLRAQLAAETVPEPVLKPALEAIVAAACAFTDTDRGCIQLISDDGKRLEMFAWCGHDEHSRFVQHFLHQGSETASNAARRDRRRLLIEDVETFPGLTGTADREIALAEGIRATQHTPIFSRSGELLGILSNQFRGPHRPSDEQLRRIDLLAWTAADFIERYHAEEARRASAARQAFLLRFGDALRAERSPEAVGALATRMLAEYMGVDRSYICRLSREQNLAWIGLEYHDPDVAPAAGEYRFADFPQSMRRLETEPLIIDDLQNDPTLAEPDKQSIEAMGMNAILTGVLRKGEQNHVWALVVGDSGSRVWTEGDRALVEEAAERTWTTMEHARAEAALHDSEAWLAGQKAAFQAAMNGEPLTASLGALVRTAVQQTKGESRAAFYAADADGKSLYHVTGMAETYARHINGFPIGPESLACGLATYAGEPAITRDVMEDPHWEPWRWLAREHDFRACWSFPVRTTGGPTLGTLALYFKEPRDPSPRDMELATVLAHAAAIIISRQKETEERARVEATLRRSEERQAFLLKLSDALRLVDDPIQDQELAARMLGEHLAAGRAFYFRTEREAGGYIHVVERDFFLSPDMPSLIGHHPQAALGREVFAPLADGRTVTIPDIGDSALIGRDQLERYHSLGIRSFVAVPLIKRGEYVAGFVAMKSVPHDWTTAEIALIEEVVERTWAAVERARAEEHRTLLVNELNHRVKNMLATVQSIATQTLGEAPDFVNRLIALAKAHNLLNRRHWRDTSLHELIEQELAPYAQDEHKRHAVSGDDVVLPPNTALSLAMAMHELVTNAVKYGALSRPGGNIQIISELREAGGARLLRLSWTESGGPAVEPPRHKGFGSRVLTRGLSYELGGEVRMDFRPAGLACTMEIPLAEQVGDGG